MPVADEIKEMDRILQGGQHIGDQSQDVRDCNLISSMETTAYDAACSFNNPQMLCQLPICQSNLELPGPEDKELVEIVVSTPRIARAQ